MAFLAIRIFSFYADFLERQYLPRPSSREIEHAAVRVDPVAEPVKTTCRQVSLPWRARWRPQDCTVIHIERKGLGSAGR